MAPAGDMTPPTGGGVSYACTGGANKPAIMTSAVINPIGTSLHRQIIVLPSRHLHRLAAEHRQSAGDARAGGARHDDVVDIAAFGGDEWRQEPFLVFLGALGDLVGVA